MHILGQIITVPDTFVGWIWLKKVRKVEKLQTCGDSYLIEFTWDHPTCTFADLLDAACADDREKRDGQRNNGDNPHRLRKIEDAYSRCR